MNDDLTTFMGKPFSYWAELQRHADNLNYTTLIEDNARLRRRVNELESTRSVTYEIASLPREDKRLILEIRYA